jgi:hypothetical protein
LTSTKIKGNVNKILSINIMEIYQELILRIVISFLFVYLLDGIIEMMFNKSLKNESKSKKKDLKKRTKLLPQTKKPARNDLQNVFIRSPNEYQNPTQKMNMLASDYNNCLKDSEGNEEACEYIKNLMDNEMTN